jgi:hypothetical protein
MRYPLRVLIGQPNFDTIPVIKLACPTTMPILQRIYCQAQMVVSENILIIRLLAFEAEPGEDSRFELILVGPAGKSVINVDAKGNFAFNTPQGDRSHAMKTRRIAGEDLQGVYWGAVLELPMTTLLHYLGIESPLNEAAILGNIIKKGPGCCAAFIQDNVCRDHEPVLGEFSPIF